MSFFNWLFILPVLALGTPVQHQERAVQIIPYENPLVPGVPLIPNPFADPLQPGSPYSGSGRPQKEPCADVQKAWLEAKAKDANLTVSPTIDAQLAYDCLQTVPLGKKEAVEMVESLIPYVEWQSNLAFLKDPPKDYFYGPTDIIANLNKVKENITKDVYVNEYAFQVSLLDVWSAVHDGHFQYFPDAINIAFVFKRPFPLASFSADGVALEKIYSYNDTVLAARDPKFKPSAITKINHIEASEYLQKLANERGVSQDPDGAYNSMFFSAADAGSPDPIGGLFHGAGALGRIFQGPTTTFDFENGTQLVLPNVAKIHGNFTEVHDGPSFYKHFCVDEKIFLNDTPSRILTQTPGYPKPVVISEDAIIGGYYLDEPGLEEVAVLSVLNFEPNSTITFQHVVESFLATAAAAGKKKIIIDLQLNPGGYLLLAYDMFRQFFPSIVEDGFTRFRQHETLEAIAKSVSAAVPVGFNVATNDSLELVSDWESVYNYRFDLDVTGQPFKTFADKFPNRMLHGDHFTNIIRWNLSDPILTDNQTFGIGITISGYGDRKNLTQHFAAENIVLLYDGWCASTCATFSAFMKNQAKVKSIAMGGRPSKTPIQGVGGTKGAQTYDLTYIYSDAQYAWNLTNQTGGVAPKSVMFNDIAIKRSAGGGVNLRDNILAANLVDGIPAQLVTEVTDCRLFWTQPMITDVKAIWNAAARSAWGGKPCVAGSMGPASLGKGTPSKLKGQMDFKSKVVRIPDGLVKDVSWYKKQGKKLAL